MDLETSKKKMNEEHSNCTKERKTLENELAKTKEKVLVLTAELETSNLNIEKVKENYIKELSSNDKLISNLCLENEKLTAKQNELVRAVIPMIN